MSGPVAALALLATLASVPVPAPAQELLAGAAAVDFDIPPGTPLAGYGGFPRRAPIPDMLDRFDQAFWFSPSRPGHDPVRARALVLQSGTTRLLWLTADLVGVAHSLRDGLRRRLESGGRSYSGLIISASHTHSGPGAFADSALFAFLALDRQAPLVRDRILDGLERAAVEAERRREPAYLAATSAEVNGIGRSRLRAPLDIELGVLKVVAGGGRPIAVLWNYAIHGTALGKQNLVLSGDLMGEASTRIEREIRAPALYVNGAVADVSPRGRGWQGVGSGATALSNATLDLWRVMEARADARLGILSERVPLGTPAVSARNCLGSWVPRGVRIGLGGALPESTELIAVRVGPAAWVCIPGELQTRLGLEIKTAGRRHFLHAFVAGVSNDYLGYFLAPADYDRPSYIACASLYGDAGGPRLRDAAIGLLGRLAGTGGPAERVPR